MCSGLNEGCVWCNKNTLEVQNQLTPGSILKVNCSSNRKHVEGLRELKFNEKYNIAVSELGIGRRIVWRCTLRHGDKVKSSQTIWRAYRGASQARSGEKRSWIARVDGIYLEKNGKAKGLEHHWILLPLNLWLLVTAGSIVQECCFARFVYVFFTAASLSHYAVSSIDGSSQSRICGLPDLLVTGTIVQECRLARSSNYITAASVTLRRLKHRRFFTESTMRPSNRSCCT
ncbi:unnamed protein product [Brassica rapa]|uniref:BnaA02g07490D protein n=2 Tax=Brassica TaxID=3705 RepID=A0A078H5F0_BRANA|nr:unnamed protein product [Brassica rapa]CDY32687.1 BnaA02g07490D [Brassica napus]VDC86472.1 unnamed protein product [Brassica rapa]